MARPSNTGAVKCGAPSQAAFSISVKSIGLPQPNPFVSTA
jgi:hypothetical protein